VQSKLWTYVDTYTRLNRRPTFGVHFSCSKQIPYTVLWYSWKVRLTLASVFS